jgi:pyrophosphatase PpaX
MKLRGIIFDLDGTLADTLGVCLQAFQETLQYYSGRSISLQELYPMFGPSEEGILRKLLPDQAEDVYPRYLCSYERLHQECTQPFPGIEELLDDLRSRGLRIAIATGKSVETAAISMRILGMDSKVDRLETGFIDRGDKPELIRRVLGYWGISPDQAAYVGDILSDMYAAEQAGVQPIGAAWADTSTLRAIEQKDGWVVFERVQDFAAWIQQVED